MKKTFFLFILLSLIVSCSEENENEVQNQKPAPPAATNMHLSVNELFFNAGVETQSVIFTCDKAWEVSDDASWCEVTPSSGKGEQSIHVTVEKNTDDKERNCTVTFSNKEQTLTLAVKQYQELRSDFVDLKTEQQGVQTQYNETNGDVTIQYSTGTVPAVKVGETFVLPESHNYDIRVIQHFKVNGNTLQMKTKQGNMSDLFKNIDFTLTSNSQSVPVHTRTNGHRIYTPAKIIGHTKAGRVLLFDRTTLTRTSNIESDNGNLEINQPFFVFEQDFSNHDLYNKDGARLYWEKCNYGIRMDGVFKFSFGECIKDGRIVGLPKKFSAELVGNYAANLQLKCEATKELYLGNKEDVLSEQSILYKTFIFYPNGIPVPVTIDTRMGTRNRARVETHTEMGAGFSMDAEARFGVAYEHGQITPIHSFTPNLTVKMPTITVKGTAFARLSYYPSIHIKLFNFVGPVIEPIPFVAEKYNIALSTGDERSDWSSFLSAGADLRLGLKMDFLKFGEQEWKSDLIPILRQPLIVMPLRMVYLSPKNGLPTVYRTHHNIQLRVDGYNYLKKQYFPCPLAFVTACHDYKASQKEETLITNESGIVNTYGAAGTAYFCAARTDLKFAIYKTDTGQEYIDWYGNTFTDFEDRDWGWDEE